MKWFTKRLAVIAFLTVTPSVFAETALEGNSLINLLGLVKEHPRVTEYVRYLEKNGSGVQNIKYYGISYPAQGVTLEYDARNVLWRVSLNNTYYRDEGMKQFAGALPLGHRWDMTQQDFEHLYGPLDNFDYQSEKHGYVSRGVGNIGYPTGLKIDLKIDSSGIGEIAYTRFTQVRKPFGVAQSYQHVAKKNSVHTGRVPIIRKASMVRQPAPVSMPIATMNRSTMDKSRTRPTPRELRPVLSRNKPAMKPLKPAVLRQPTVSQPLATAPANPRKPMAKRRLGCIVGSCAHGEGLFVFRQGWSYQGQFRNNEPNGYGKIKSAHGTGAGRIRHFYGIFDGEGTIVYANGNRFTGSWYSDRVGQFYPDGEGSMSYSDGRTVKGHWRNGKHHDAVH